ncbi:hypothetical protein V8D89_011087 [Ganoderma adspersum]
MPPKPIQPSATNASPPSPGSTAVNRVLSARPASRTIVAAKESSLSLSIPNTDSKALTIRQDWFNVYLPGEDLPVNLQWTAFNIDLTSEHTMYAGLLMGCHGLETRSTYRHPDNTVSSNGLTTRICPDVGIYPASRPDLDAPQSSTSANASESIRVRFGSVEVPVEVKRLIVRREAASSTGTPAVDTPPSSSTPNPSTPLPDIASTSWNDVVILSSEGNYAIPLSLEAHRGQLVEYVVEVFNRKHRLFVFMILFVNDKGRLLRFDRTGVSMTVEFDYTQRPEILGKFLDRISPSRAVMGHDPAVVPADAAEENMFPVGRGLKDAAMDGWSIYKLSIEGRFSPDDSRAVLPTAPVSRREYLIGKPMFGNISLSGRGTKAHIGYDVAEDRVVFIKDSWRLNSTNVRSEYDTYLLNEAVRQSDQSVKFNVPTLLGGGDVVVTGVVQQTQTSNRDLLTRIHFRLVLKEICRLLEDFTMSSELVRVTMSAFSAHSIAWVVAKILHRDVSVGNILILDENPQELPNPKTSQGLLADWDLARTKEELENPAFTRTTRSPHELSDDLESFVHVLNYCALKHLPNNLSNDDYRLALFISSVYDRGSKDKLDLPVGNKPFVQLEPRNQPLHYLLEALSHLCYQHYYHIQFPPPRLPPDQPREGMSILEDNIEEWGVVLPSLEVKRRPPPLVLRPPTRTTAALPDPDPSQSPFQDHVVMGEQLYYAIRPPADHPAHGLLTKPLDVTPSVSVSPSGKRQSAGFPSYAPFGVADPGFSLPAKHARMTPSDSRGSGSGTSGKVQKKAPRTSADASRTHSEASEPAAGPSQYIDPMALRSDRESRWSRSTTPESERRFGEEGEDTDNDNPEPDTNESDAPPAVSDGPSHQYTERITDMAAELDEIQFR